MTDRALIIHKQYLDLIFDHGKIWEMRSRPINVRGRIGLIEARSGLIVGEATLTDSLPRQSITELYENFPNFQVPIHKLGKWRFPWVLYGAKRYARPIPYTHPPGAVIWVKINLPGIDHAEANGWQL